MSWRFIAHIKDLEEFTDEQANALYEAGCSDATLGSSCGRAKIAFDRQSPTLQSAIHSAIAEIAQTGLVVSSIEIIAADLSELPQ